MLMESALGTLSFHTGWKTARKISFQRREYTITVKFQAYFEKDGLTAKQQEAGKRYARDESAFLKKAEAALAAAFPASGGKERFLPRTLLFKRDGSFALLCDDNKSPDEGIAISYGETVKVLSQDEYL